MKILPFISCLLACSAAPNHLNTVIVTNAVFKEKFVIYTGQHDIVNIYVPVNGNNFQTGYPRVWFFVEADTNSGERVDQGLYVYKDRRATKVFNKGRDAVANNENVIYFGASDGIYTYNEGLNTAEKHGTITDNIIQMSYNNATNNFYYLTANHEVFKLNSDATVSVKLPLKNLQALVFGFEGNMYYYDTEKNVYVFSDVPDSTPRKIVGLPSTINKLTLVAMNGMDEGALLLVDKSVYVLKPDGTVSRNFISTIGVDIEVELSAYCPQPTMLQLYAKDKKLYEFNLFTMKNELKPLIGL